MPQAKQFQYDTQQYQEDCINNIVGIFAELHQNRSFNEVITEHKLANNYNFTIKQTKNIDVMMETGTGKTFTFIKTMFELNRRFGYKKFIILIPSVAIREGTKTNLEDTQYYFKSLYSNEKDKKIQVFVYESGKLSVINQYVADRNKFSVLVMTPASFNSDTNLLNKPLERDIFLDNISKPPKNYLDCLKMLNPIIIMDEPHKFKGDAFLTYFEGFNNYFLRFGATFPKDEKDERIIPFSNVAYTLDSISAFQQNLVKKIVVYTQDVVQNSQTLISVVNDKEIKVNSLVNSDIRRETLRKGSKFNGKIITKINKYKDKNKDNIVLSNGDIVKIDYNLPDEALRQMISMAIKIHFDKEQALFEKGIKALALFFIGNIKMFRGENPKIKNIFEEEYVKQREEKIQKCEGQYLEYLKKDYDESGKLQVHKGYFSGDGDNKEDQIKAGVDEILKDKKKLLSFESSTRFIFSIWALQEGWDNPNVFTICKLSNYGTENSKMQQIGRGLRICVNQKLERQTVEKAFDGNQEKFWEVNNLDVVVSDKEVGFVEAIQNEILNNSFYVNETFTDSTLKKVLKEKTKLDDVTVRKLFIRLEEKGMIIFKERIDEQDVFKKSSDYYAILKAQTDLPLEQYKVLENLFVDIKNYVQEFNNKMVKQKQVRIKQEHIARFKQLWDAINKNSFYTIENLDVETEKKLIKKIAKEIGQLNITASLLQTTRSELLIEKLDQKEDAIKEETFGSEIKLSSKVDFLQFVNNLAYETKTPLRFIIKIFNALPSHFKNKILANNPAQALKEMTEIVQNNLVGCIKANVKYEIEGKISSSDLCEDKDGCYVPAGSCGKFQENISQQDFNLKEKWIFEDVIEYDSDTEKIIILHDPEIESIELFGKLPRLKIKTPFGDYNPDFCYAVKSHGNKKLFLIVESKGYDTSTKIPAKENGKIYFAKKHFELLNELYKNDSVKILYRERINNVELLQLISESLGE